MFLPGFLFYLRFLFHIVISVISFFDCGLLNAPCPHDSLLLPVVVVLRSGLTELVVDGRVYGRTEGIIEREHTISARIDGHDVRQVTQESLRQNVGVVQQDVFLFAASILENIRYGKPGASEEEVARAAKLAEIYDDIVALPEGFNTYVGERGTLLSGGQKQRISIARIFLKDPPVLILDEATSSIDTRTEVRIQAAFARMMQGRTSFIVAHRLSTIREADVILVMKDGRIVEQGGHDALLAQGGFYAKLYNSQFEGVET